MKYKYLGLFLAVSQAAAHFYEGPPPPPHMSPLEREAFHRIEDVCRYDLERHCFPQEAVADPILKWLMTPERLAPPMVHPDALSPMDPINIGPLLDHMMDTTLRMSTMIEANIEPVFFVIFEESPEPPSEELMLDSMLSKLMQHINCEKGQAMQQTEDEPVHDISHHMRLKGQAVLEQENVPEDRLRLARRLTEVNPEELAQFQAFHHLGHNHDFAEDHHRISPSKYQCLMQARRQNRVLPECAGVMSHFEKVREIEMQQRHEMHLYITFFWFYCMLFFALVSLILMRKFKSSKGLFLLRLRILQAVYSNPEIKAKVEDEVGAPLGSVPPLPSAALKMLSRAGREQFHRKNQRVCYIFYGMLAFFALDAFGLLPECWPLVVMVGCCVFLVVRIVNVCARKPEIRECKCYCCGGSTLDVENGTVSKEQACCTCCKGTGVCSIKCASCSGGVGDKEGSGTCCGGNCTFANDTNCDGSGGCYEEGKTVVYHGVPIQIV